MTTKSRIKFNPETREIEIEGSEKFVKTYFGKIQELLSGGAKKASTKPIKKLSATKEKKSVTPKVKGRKTSMSKTVISLIQGSKNGMTTARLEDETGLDKKLIWAIIYRAEKRGKIKKAGRGLYIGA